MAQAYSQDLRERVIKSYESGMAKKEILNIFMIGSDTLNRWIRRYKETGRVDAYQRRKYRAKKFSDAELLEHVDKNPSATLEERGNFFSVTAQSIHTRMKALGITRKKRVFSMKNGTKNKGMNL